MKLTTFNCPECGAPLEPVEDAMFMYCKYCGAKIMMDDIEFYKENAKTQRERIRTDAEVRKTELKHQSEVDLEREKRLSQESEDRSFLITACVTFGFMIFLLLLGCVLSVLGIIQ
jgi:DNA-directed RNA polymerase subunit RPC12/RpoP|nr:MAG TPA: DNA-directed RNA polymerase [Caudoviricetes sp.]